MAKKTHSSQQQVDTKKQRENLADIDRYRQMIDAGQEDDAIWYNLGVHYMALEEWDQAESAFLKALEWDGDMIQSLFNLAGVYIYQDKYEKSLEINRKLLEIDPGFIHVRSNVATALIALERYKECIAELSIVLETEPKHPIALVNMSRAYGFLGDTGKMLKYKEKAEAVGVKL